MIEYPHSLKCKMTLQYLGHRLIKPQFLIQYIHYKKYYDQLQLPNKQQGRNEKCNCGSGLKYKKCCLNKTEEV